MSMTGRLPLTISPVRLVHVAGFLAVVAGVCVWGYLLFQPVETKASQEVEVSAVSVDAAGLAMAEWFGSEPVRLDVEVIGLVRKPNRAVAVLSINGAPPQAYMAGEQLMNDVTLTAIKSDGVTVERNGVISQVDAPMAPDSGVEGIKRVPQV